MPLKLFMPDSKSLADHLFPVNEALIPMLHPVGFELSHHRHSGLHSKNIVILNCCKILQVMTKRMELQQH
jgi:hypothetical protein